MFANTTTDANGTILGNLGSVEFVHKLDNTQLASMGIGVLAVGFLLLYINKQMNK